MWWNWQAGTTLVLFHPHLFEAGRSFTRCAIVKSFTITSCDSAKRRVPVIPSLSVKGVGSKLCWDSISAGTSNFNVCTYFRSFDVLFYGKLCVFVFVVINLVPGEVWFVIWRRLSGRINNLAALEIKDFKIKAVSSYSHPKLRIFSILLLWESQSFIFIA